MNKFHLAILSCLIFLFITNTSTAGIAPTFNMTVKNIRTTNPGSTIRDSIMTFEVWLQQTNQGQPGVYDLEYGAGQYAFSYNKAIHSPGGNLRLNLNSTGNDLPAALRPPTFQVDSINGLLKGSANLPQSMTNWFAPGTFPGSKILTFRLRTNKAFFNSAPLNLRFKIGSSPNTFIAYMLPYPDSVDSESFPSQFAVALMDTIANQYSVEGKYIYMPIIRVKLTSIIEGKYNNVFNLLTKKDSVNVYLRSSTAPFQMKDSAKGVLDTVNFSGQFTFNNSLSAKYYIVVKHNQGIETWSKAGGDSLTENGPIYDYDFTTSASKAYSNNLILKGSKYCMFSGDINQDGYINLTDVIAIHNDKSVFLSGDSITDLNGDKYVDLSDLLICINNCNDFIRVRNP